MLSLRFHHARVLRALTAGLVCATFVFAGCGNKNKRPDSDLVSDKDPVRGFLATIPAETPYAFVAIDPMPIGPMLGWLDGWATSLQTMMPNIDQTLSDEYVASETKLVYAVISEMSGNYSVEGFKRLGLSVSPRFAVYGIGVLPALRMDLDDPDAFKALVSRVETKSGFKSQPETLGETDFWKYRVDDGYIVMAVVNRQLVWGYTPTETAELFTATLIGEKLPEKSMANDDRITPVAKKHGFQRYGAGFIDFGRFAQIMLEPGTGLNDQIQALLDPGDRPPVSAECLSETKRLITQVPRMVFGYEEWSGSTARIGMGLEVTTDLGKRLAEAKTTAPLVGSDMATQAPFAVAFGFDVGKVLDTIGAQLAAVQGSPYQCNWFSDINGLANEFSAYSMLVPAMITNLRGGGVLVQNVRSVPASAASPPIGPDGTVDPNMMASDPAFKVEGIAMVNSTAPSALLAWLRTLAPEFENVTPDPQGIPLALPPSEMLTMLDDPHVVLTQSSLAVTSGAGIADEAARVVAAAPSTEAPFFTLSYDLKKAWGMFSESGVPASPLMNTFALGRTEITLDPRESALFMHVEMAMTAPKPNP